MKSYVISVSLMPGCYRHIQISSSATLYRLHKAILLAFEFDDDHLHAFFIDNKIWSNDAYFSPIEAPGDRLTTNYKLRQLRLSKGKCFKYLFDFGFEWVFQCKVLKESDEETPIPKIVRSVGESPEQYPEYDENWEEDDEYWDDSDDPEGWDDYSEDDVFEDFFDTFPDKYPPERCRELYNALKLPKDTVNNIKAYFESAARIYAILPLKDLYEIYNQQNEPVTQEEFLSVAEIIRHEHHIEFMILGVENLYDTMLVSEPMEREIVAQHLIIDGPDEYYELLKEIKDKPLKIFNRDEYILFSDQDYYPLTDQTEKMRKFLNQTLSFGKKKIDDILFGIHLMISMNFDIKSVLKCSEAEELAFENQRDLDLFTALFNELNIHTHKYINRGYTDFELKALLYKKKNNIEDQLNMFD